MSKIVEYRCDRCGEPVKPPFDTVTRRGSNYDLCVKCWKALNRFLDGQDEVGDYIFEEVDGPCPHHVPCAYPCTTVWERRKRE